MSHPLFNVAGEGHVQGVGGPLQGVIPCFTQGEGLGHVGEVGDEGPVFIGADVQRVGHAQSTPSQEEALSCSLKNRLSFAKLISAMLVFWVKGFSLAHSSRF